MKQYAVLVGLVLQMDHNIKIYIYKQIKYNKMEKDTLIDRKSRFDDNNIEVSGGFWLCCRDCFNCLVCIQWCRGGSVTIS